MGQRSWPVQVQSFRSFASLECWNERELRNQRREGSSHPYADWRLRDSKLWERILVSAMSRRRPTILALPAGVKFSDFDFQPTWQEVEWERWLRAKAEYEKTWLEAAQKELAILACIVERDARENALEEFHQRRQRFYREQAEKEAEQDKRQMELYLADLQKQLDAPRLRAELSKLECIGREIKRENARIERTELMRRNVVRGRKGVIDA